MGITAIDEGMRQIGNEREAFLGESRARYCPGCEGQHVTQLNVLKIKNQPGNDTSEKARGPLSVLIPHQGI